MSFQTAKVHWWQQPLVHFVVFGAVLFGVYQWRSAQPAHLVHAVAIPDHNAIVMAAGV